MEPPPTMPQAAGNQSKFRRFAPAECRPSGESGINLGGGMDGFALIEEIRRRSPEAGVVVMTGKPPNLDGRSADRREVFLLKPFGPPRLAAAVHELMGRSRR